MYDIFQLQDLDGESQGLLQTNMALDILTKEWSEYVNNYEAEDFGVEEFLDLMESKHPESLFERFFITDIIQP